jgi:hypothetical protein
VSDELARRVAGFLELNAIAYALIGATAVGRYGVTRATMDIDFFVVDADVLKQELWTPFGDSVQVDCRRGDFEDPLRGLVRLRDDQGEIVDVVVGKWKWQAGVVKRSQPATMWGHAVPVARASDLILLKLYAGGGKDAWDITELLAVLDSSVIAEVEEHLPDLQHDARDLWQRILSRR